MPAFDLGPAFAGWRVYFEHSLAEAPGPVVGRPCVARLRDGRTLFATPERAADGLALRSVAGELLDAAAIVWTGRIVTLKPERMAWTTRTARSRN